ncbi:DNAJ heat shock N-terminal domain-containing protein, partial [Striga asiatica]
MDEVNHYTVLGLPSGEESAGLTDQEINKAYRSKARELHPNKRPNDPNAHANFLKLQTSYEVLKDEKARKLFDELLRVKKEKLNRKGQQDSKRRKMMSDLEERERSVFSVDPTVRAREEEEMIIAQKLKDEISSLVVWKMWSLRALRRKGCYYWECVGYLLVLPLQPVAFSTEKNEADGPKLSNLVGDGCQAREDSILKKMRKVWLLHRGRSVTPEMKEGYTFYGFHQFSKTVYENIPLWKLSL